MRQLIVLDTSVDDIQEPNAESRLKTDIVTALDDIPDALRQPTKAGSAP